MPNWAGSNWYFLRYCDPQNEREFADQEKLRYWLPVDWYNGGMEHTTLHLLYSRFIYKVLYDCGYVPTPEPYAKRTSHGVVLGPDGRKMSKSRGNVVNPDEVVSAFGADTFRVYECFMGPFGQVVAWDPQSVEGCSRFLRRIWRSVTAATPVGGVAEERGGSGGSLELQKNLHRLVKKVGEDIEAMKFNTAIAAMMGFLNSWLASPPGSLSVEEVGVFLRLLAPFAPHLAEELWECLGGEFSVHQQPWPEYDPSLIREGRVIVAVQVDGKLRTRLEMSSGLSEEEARDLVLDDSKVQDYLSGRTLERVVWVPDRLMNLVTAVG